MKSPRIGAHVSISKGLLVALDKIQTMGGNCLQLFASPPRSFTPSRLSDPDCALFKKQALEKDIGPNFIHATYLINLGAQTDKHWEVSIASLINDLEIAEKIGAYGSIVHTGSHKGKGFTNVLPRVVDGINRVLGKTPGNTKLFLEIASGGNGKIGSSFEELSEILVASGNERLGVCLDTAHMFAGGYGFDTEKKVEALSQKIHDTIGWERVGCVHVNDSKSDFGSFLDRHENIGEGKIGKGTLALLLTHPEFRKVPLILETPGFDDKGPDKKNIDILKSLL